MGAVMIVFPILMFAVFLLPWVALLAVPLAVFLVSGGIIFAGLSRWVAAGRMVEALGEGLLALVGLDMEPNLESLVRGAIGRTLGLAPAASRAAACACVKPAAGSFVGVLRIWNARGHYLFRAPGRSVAAVANAIVEQLGAAGDRFPAREGVAWARVHECDPRTCPLRQLRMIARTQAATA